MSSPGRRIDRYVVEQELDAGGFGQVFRARHGVTGRAVALKLLHASRESSFDVVERFLREARILSAISSPHVVQVLDAGISDDKKIFLALELLEGESLAKRIARAGPLPAREAITIARQILAGLAAAHAVGVVHRDLKPANVFLTRVPGGDDVAKVLDFGISKSSARGAESVITMTGAVLGTPHYMAPEQLYGARDVDARADLYALAVCLYEMLSGELPYSARTLDSLIAQRLSEPPTPLAARAPHLPPPLLAIVDRGLARDPDARCRGAAELDAALAALERTALPPTSLPTPGPAPPTHAPHRPPAAPSTPGPSTPGPSTPGPRMVSPISTASSGPAPNDERASNAMLLVMLGGALAVIVLLVLTLLGVVGALVWVRASAPAPAPVITPVPTAPSAPGAPGGAAPEPAAPEPPAPPPEQPTRAWTERIVGGVDASAVDRLIERAGPGIERCRHGTPEDVRVQIFVSRGGQMPLVQPPVMEPHGDEATARCVAQALRAAGPFDDLESDGIAIVGAHVAP